MENSCAGAAQWDCSLSDWSWVVGAALILHGLPKIKNPFGRITFCPIADDGEQAITLLRRSYDLAVSRKAHTSV